MSSLENQLPCQQTFGSRSRACRRACIICGAQKQEDKEKDIVGGIDINQEGDIWEGEAVGVAVKVSMLTNLKAVRTGQVYYSASIHFRKCH